MIRSSTLPPLIVMALVAMTLGAMTQSLPGQRLATGVRVEVDGIWEAPILRVEKIVIEKPDDLVEIKGYYDDLDLDARVLTVGPFRVEVPADCDIDDDHDEGDSYHLDELLPEWRLKIEGELVAPGVFVAEEIDVDRKSPREDPPVLEIEAFIEGSVDEDDDGNRHITLLGIECLVGPDLDVPDQVVRQGPQRDDDEDRPDDQLSFGPLTIGGEFQLDFDYEDNFDLDDGDNEDITLLDTSMILEGLYRFDSRRYAFAKMRSAKAYVLNDEERDLDREEETQLEELNVYWGNFLHRDLSIQVGRQDFDEPREWLYDENLDAVRLFWRPRPFEIEYSWSTYLANAPRGRSDVLNQILLLRWKHAPKSQIEAYMLDIQDDSRADNSPFYLGLRAHSKTSRRLYWFDYAYLDGVEGTDRLESHAVDLGLGYRFPDLPLSPYFYGGFAWAKGDDKASGRTDRNFRQTGYQDNNQKFFGVASFRYYGELLRPELSNLQVWTVGVGFEPFEDASVDLLFHRYDQDVASSIIRDSELRESPSGLSRDLGTEIDLVFGIDDVWDHLDLELDVGYFMPGNAFVNNDDDALWVSVQIEWNF